MCLKEARWRHTKRRGDALDIIEADVALGALDRADIGAVEPAFIGEGLLAETFPPPQGTDVRRNHFPQISNFRASRHSATVGRR
jgi:hypothetical protein